MTTTKQKAKQSESPRKRAPRNRIQEELEARRSPDGRLYGDVIHAWAENHRDSAIGRALEWDDTKAGYEYRLIQIRTLIRVHTITVNNTPTYVSLRIDRPIGGGYRHIRDVMQTPTLRACALADALQDLKRVQTKYQHLTELAEIWEAVERVEAEFA